MKSMIVRKADEYINIQSFRQKIKIKSTFEFY